MDANLVRRVGFAVVAIPLALLLVWYGGLRSASCWPSWARSARGSCSISPSRGNVRPVRPLALLSAGALALLAYGVIVAGDVRRWVGPVALSRRDLAVASAQLGARARGPTERRLPPPA